MFRLFLRNKLLSGSQASAATGSEAVAPIAAKAVERMRNRRVFERYAADHKHLTLMNEQDILLIREISAKGFSTEVAPRTSERLVIGDVYEARIRYLGEIYDLESRVAWKAENFVGFEIVNATRETLLFIKRILQPMEIAGSLREVEASFVADSESGKTWLHGDNNSDLYIWRSPDSGSVTAWQLAVEKTWIEWRDGEGLATGSLRPPGANEIVRGGALQSSVQERDANVDTQRRQLALDVFMAMAAPLREELLATLSAR